MLNPEIEEAIAEAARSLGQPPALTAKVVAWMGDLTRGVETLKDRDSVALRLDLLYNATSTMDVADGLPDAEHHAR